MPAAYGLGILYQPSAANMPAACREHLRSLGVAVALLEKFFETYETNHLTLFLWSEQTSIAYRKLEEAYQGLLAHSNALEEEYRRLLSIYTKSNKEHAGV